MIWYVEPPHAIAWAGQNGVEKSLILAEILVKERCPPGSTIYFLPGPGQYQMTGATVQAVTSWTEDFKSVEKTVEIASPTFCSLINSGVEGTADAPVRLIGVSASDGPPTIQGYGLMGSTAFEVAGSYITFRNFHIVGCNSPFTINSFDTKTTLFTCVGVRIEDCEISDYGTASLTGLVALWSENKFNTPVPQIINGKTIRPNPRINGFPPGGIFTSLAVHDLTVANCYFHDLGSKHIDDFLGPDHFLGDPDPHAYSKYLGDYDQYFAHGHALYLNGSGHKITDCRFERISQGYAIKCDAHWVQVDPLNPSAPPTELPSQLDSTLVPWASHLIQNCQFAEANAPGFDTKTPQGTGFPLAGPAGYIAAYGSSNFGPPPNFEYDSEAKIVTKNYSGIGANIAIVNCDFMGTRDYFAAVDLPPGGGWPPPDYAKIAIVACRLYCAYAPNLAAHATLDGQPCTGRWTYGDATGINYGSVVPQVWKDAMTKEDRDAFLVPLGWVGHDFWPKTSYYCKDFKIGTNIPVTAQDWADWFGTDLLILYSDKRAYVGKPEYGQPYPTTEIGSPGPIGSERKDWHTWDPNPGTFGTPWWGLPLGFSLDNVPDQQDFFVFDGERRWSAEWVDNPWRIG
jgi:hypothetical protein